MTVVTDNQLKRIEKDWSKYAEENIECEVIGGAIYTFTSELAALRLFHSYRYTFKKNEGLIAVGFSQTYNSWYFRLEMTGGA